MFVLSTESLYIPLHSNMYYAMNKRDDLCFKISKKKLSKNDRRRKDFQNVSKPTVTNNFTIKTST